jgi:Transposase IS66 family
MASSVPGLIAFASMCSKAEAVVDHGEVAAGQFETMVIDVGNHLTAGRRSWSRLGLDRKRRRTGHNLLLRLAARKQDVPRFPIDPRVPVTNNVAERDGRMMKVKTEDLLRSLEGAMNFAIIRSPIGTALKRGWNVIQVFSQTSKALAAKLQAG